MRASRLIVATLVFAACSGGDEAKPTPKTAADQIAASSGPGEHFESARGQFAMEFPSFWKGQYRAVERNDTTAGARMTVEFVFTPPAGSSEQESTLFLVRVFPSKAWNAAKARPGPPIAVEAGSKGDDIYGLSFAPKNPYGVGTPVAAKFDSLMLSVVNGPPQVRLSAK
jgi:hypothetical protein